MKTCAVIVVSWNTRELLRQCLASIDAATTQADRQVIVVDNASTDGSADMVATAFPAVRLIRNSTNDGFARANNQGMAVSDADTYVLLNSDTIASTGVIESLASRLQSHADWGAISPLLRTPAGTAQPYAFGGDPTPVYLLRRGLNRALLRRPLHDWQPAGCIPVDWVSGACIALRGAAVRDIGGFDERMFMYFEDNELCLRLRKSGLLVRYCADLSITHIGGQSLSQNPAARRAYRDSLRYFYRKHYSVLAQLVLRIMLPVYARMTP